METSAAKRPRLEHNYCQDPEEIIQEQREIIKNQKARIEQLEELLKEVLITGPEITWSKHIVAQLAE